MSDLCIGRNPRFLKYWNGPDPVAIGTIRPVAILLAPTGAAWLAAAVGIASLSAGGAGKEQEVPALLDSGAALSKRTPSGAYSLSRDVLEGLAATSEIANNLHQARRNH